MPSLPSRWRSHHKETQLATTCLLPFSFAFQMVMMLNAGVATAHTIVTMNIT
jgi:hypothetical protein